MRWDRWWRFWLGSTVGSFFVLETAALVARSKGAKGATLSSALRRWLGIEPRTGRRLLLSASFAAFWAWFVHHILS